MTILPDQTDIERTAARLADAARVETLTYFRTAGLVADNKRPEDFDPVTVADRASEAAMREILDEARPDDGILGEEFPHKPSKNGLTWVLDPIDGTRGYISGTPTWGVLISLRNADGPFFGIIDQPYIGERFVGGYGRAYVEGPHGTHDLKTRPPRPLAEATVFTTFPEVGTPDDRIGFEAVSEKANLTRYGMDCYAYALLAAGQIDLVIEADLQEYDISGPHAVVTAAGGVVTDWTGAPAYEGGRVIAAANPEIHAEALAILRKF